MELNTKNHTNYNIDTCIHECEYMNRSEAMIYLRQLIEDCSSDDELIEFANNAIFCLGTGNRDVVFNDYLYKDELAHICNVVDNRSLK